MSKPTLPDNDLPVLCEIAHIEITANHHRRGYDITVLGHDAEDDDQTTWTGWSPGLQGIEEIINILRLKTPCKL